MNSLPHNKLGFVKAVKPFSDYWRIRLWVDMRAHGIPEVIGGITYHPVSSDSRDYNIMRRLMKNRIKNVKY